MCIAVVTSFSLLVSVDGVLSFSLLQSRFVLDPRVQHSMYIYAYIAKTEASSTLHPAAEIE